MRIRFIPFEKLPYADTCWALIEGPDLVTGHVLPVEGGLLIGT